MIETENPTLRDPESFETKNNMSERDLRCTILVQRLPAPKKNLQEGFARVTRDCFARRVARTHDFLPV